MRKETGYWMRDFSKFTDSELRAEMENLNKQRAIFASNTEDPTRLSTLRMQGEAYVREIDAEINVIYNLLRKRVR